MTPFHHSHFNLRRWPESLLAIGFVAGTLLCLWVPDATADNQLRQAVRNGVTAQPLGQAPSRQKVFAMVIDEARRLNFSPSLALAVAKTESDFNAHALSHAGARGVMQIMPLTGRTELGLRPGQLWDARTNIRGGIKFLDHLISAYGGRVDIALSHYNGGSRVRRPNGQLRVIPATRQYVKKVQRLERQFAKDRRVMVAGLKHKQQSPRPDQSRTSRFRSEDKKSDGVTYVYGSRRQVDKLADRQDRLDRGLERLDHRLSRIGRLLNGEAPRRQLWQGAQDSDW